MPPKGKKKSGRGDDDSWDDKDNDITLETVAAKVGLSGSKSKPSNFNALVTSSSGDEVEEEESSSPSDSETDDEPKKIVKGAAKAPLPSKQSPPESRKNMRGMARGKVNLDSDPERSHALSEAPHKKEGKKGKETTPQQQQQQKPFKKKTNVKQKFNETVQLEEAGSSSSSEDTQSRNKANTRSDGPDSDKERESTDSSANAKSKKSTNKGKQQKQQAKETQQKGRQTRQSEQTEAKEEAKEQRSAPKGVEKPQQSKAAMLKAEAQKKLIEAKRLEAEEKRRIAEERRLAQEAKREADKQAVAEARAAAEVAKRKAAETRKSSKPSVPKQVQQKEEEEEEPDLLERSSYRPPLASSKKKKLPKAVQEPAEDIQDKKVVDLRTEEPEEDEDDLDGWEAEAATLVNNVKQEESKAPLVELSGSKPPLTASAAQEAPPPQKREKQRVTKTGPVQSGGDAKGEAVKLRSPILCIMGHVDTGKTKLLDKIRRTNVQDREAGGITQQIGATFFPRENLLTQCEKVDANVSLKVPGLLIIDTPGHESFNNLRKRGSSLCDIAILVIDIMHGLEPQTKESIEMLRQRKCPFIVALNKVDRLYGWAAHDWNPIRTSLAAQKQHTKEEFDSRVQRILLELTSNQGLNCALYWRNDDVRRTVSIVPTSAITGEGIPDLLTLIVKLTQDRMHKKVVLDCSRIECSVLEVKVVEGLGTTVDVILISGVLHEGDTVVLCGMTGPIVTAIRALLTPHPMKELRVKGEYVHHQEIYAAMGVKISAPGLESAIAGTSMLVMKDPDDEEECARLKEEVQQDMSTILESVSRTKEGVYVMASTLGSLEALLNFLKGSKIPVAGINIGTVYKLDVKKASVMRERGHEDYSVVLAFDVKVDPEAEKEAKVLGVTIFCADIIYHLLDNFVKHLEDLKEQRKQEKSKELIMPCILTIISDCIFNKKDPLILGVKVSDGELHTNTPIIAIDKDQQQRLKIGKIESIECNKKPIKVAKKHADMEVCIKLSGDPNITYGRHFDSSWKLISAITRRSIDVMKAHFREDLEHHGKLVVHLKKLLGIV